MHLRIPFPPKQQTLKDRTEINRNASAHSLPPKQQTLKEKTEINRNASVHSLPPKQQTLKYRTEIILTTYIKRQSEICAFPSPQQQTLKGITEIKRNASVHSPPLNNKH